MIKQQIKLNDSPFKKQRTMTAPRDSDTLQTQVSTDMFEDFMRFALQYNVEHPNPNAKDPPRNKANPSNILSTSFSTHTSLSASVLMIYT